jgi:hypothetical protein
LTYQRKVGKLLAGFWPHVRIGTWLRYRDWAGEGICQPDFYVPETGRVLVFEAKLTECREAWQQLAKYGALLEAMYGVPACRVMVCRNLRWTGNPIVDPRQAVDGAVWHTLG